MTASNGNTDISKLVDLFFNSSYTCFALLDRDFNFVQVNEAYASADDKTPEFFPGKNHFDLYPSDAVDLFEKVRDSGEVYTTRARAFTYPDESTPTYWDWSLEPIKDGSDQVTHLVLSLADVTKKIKTEKHLDRFLNLSNHMMCTANFDGYFVELSPAWSRMLGYTNEQLRAKPFVEFVHPDDQQKTIDEAAKLATGDGDTIGFVNRYRAADGGWRWFSWQASSDLDTGLIYAVATDISAIKYSEEQLQQSKTTLESLVEQRTSDLQASEQRLQFLLQNSPAVIYTCKADDDFGATFISDNIKRYFGYHPEEFTSDSGFWANNIHPDDQTEIFDNLPCLFEHGSHSHEYRFRIRSGEYIWVHDDLRLIRDQQGKPVEIIGYWADITERKKVEEEIHRARQEAEQANRSKSEFLSRMSHELRTPMNAILGFAQLVMASNENSDTGENAREIYKAGNHLLELINDVLDLSKIEAGHLPISMENISLNRVLEDCFTLISPMATNRGVRIQDNVTNSTPYIVWADYTRLKQVLINLLSNAVKYNRPEGSIEINASLNDRKLLRVSITDTGGGILPDLQKKLFQPFERLGAESTEVEGTGIGLVVSRQLMHIMGGQIGVDSQPGHGSTFWIELHVGDALSQNNRTSSLVSHLATDVVKSDDVKILYVEDNPANLRLVNKIFANTSYQLMSAHTGNLGLELALTHKPDLIMLDINLPGINGFEVLGKIRQDDDLKKVPVIAISANAMTRDVERGIAAGFDQYIKKPINIAELLESVEALLRKAR